MPLFGSGIVIAGALAAGADGILTAESSNAFQGFECLFCCLLQAYLLRLGTALVRTGVGEDEVKVTTPGNKNVASRSSANVTKCEKIGFITPYFGVSGRRNKRQ